MEEDFYSLAEQYLPKYIKPRTYNIGFIININKRKIHIGKYTDFECTQIAGLFNYAPAVRVSMFSQSICSYNLNHVLYNDVSTSCETFHKFFHHVAYGDIYTKYMMYIKWNNYSTYNKETFKFKYAFTQENRLDEIALRLIRENVKNKKRKHKLWIIN